jgi:DNA invertase Pin-like site-specific DNA recombinase
MSLIFEQVGGSRFVPHVVKKKSTAIGHDVLGAQWRAIMLLCVLVANILLRNMSANHPWTMANHPLFGSVGCRRGRNSRNPFPEDPPTDPAIRCASYARFSSTLQRDESITDQQRKCREKAASNGHAISPELEFVDEAVSGTKRDRHGLNALLAAAAAGQFQVLYLHSLSRLSRESVITLPLLKQLVHNHNVRVVSVSEGIDSASTTWELIAHIMSIVHQQYLKELAENVFRGQEGTVLAGFAVGDHCFGYVTQPVPGSEQARKGRNAKPRKIYALDPQTAAWVQRIFHWFVRERRSLTWIVRELNRLGAPKDHRSQTKEWRYQYLLRLLRNPKYIGRWPWGERQNVRDPLTGKIRQRDRAAVQREKYVRDLPHLRIVDNTIFEEAQGILETNQAAFAGSRRTDGTLQGSTRGASAYHPRHLLAQLIVCSHCQRRFNVAGAGARYLRCPGYGMGCCTCRTQLRRDRAEEMILTAIGQRALLNPAWRQRVFEEAVNGWKAEEASVPSELAAARQALADVERRIANLLDQVECGHGGSELDQRLAERRAEKRALYQQVERLERTDHGRPPAPTEEWIGEQLSRLGEAFAHGTPAAAHALRLLVGGKIEVREVCEPSRSRRFLQGHFTISVGTAVAAIHREGDQAESFLQTTLGEPEEIVIDFREPPQIDASSEEAKRLADEGLLYAEIAQRLGCARSRVTHLLRHWHESRGLEVPDGHARRATLQKKCLEPSLYQRIADEVMLLYNQGLLLQEIADRLLVDRNVITAAIRWWHESRGRPIPDGRSRRKSLARKVSVRRVAPGAAADNPLPAGDPQSNADPGIVGAA